jgi:hypothetical protein
MARFPPSKWETYSVEELDRHLDEVLGPDAVTAQLQAAAFVAVRYNHKIVKIDKDKMVCHHMVLSITGPLEGKKSNSDWCWEAPST